MSGETASKKKESGGGENDEGKGGKTFGEPDQRQKRGLVASWKLVDNEARRREERGCL